MLLAVTFWFVGYAVVGDFACACDLGSVLDALGWFLIVKVVV